MLNRILSRIKARKTSSLAAAGGERPAAKAAATDINLGDTQELLQLLHPKGVFFKTLPLNSRLLDVGAGDGAISNLRGWPFPPRPDIRLYAYSLSKGTLFDQYDGWEIGDWEKSRPAFDGIQFDAMLCSHFIEHISKPWEFLDWCLTRLAPHGRIYLEWPSPFSLLTPSAEQLRASGVDNIVVSNYKDDKTHKNDLPDREKIIRYFEQHGFLVEQTGYVHFPLLEELVARHFPGSEDLYATTVAYWSKTFWAQYVIASRRPAPAR